jgi:DNA-binding transcriptional ArsR family regulator
MASAAIEKRDEARNAVFRAVADPTRRAILELLRKSERRCVNDIAAPFAMSQPAVSQHLRVLSEAGLVEARREGRQSLYRLRAKPMHDAYEWLGRYEPFWNARLDALGAYLDEEARGKKR